MPESESPQWWERGGPQFLEFPVSRRWAQAHIRAGRKPLVLLRATDTQDLLVRITSVPSDGPAAVKLPSGFEVYVPIAALRRRASSRTGDSPTGDARLFPTPPPEDPT